MSNRSLHFSSTAAARGPFTSACAPANHSDQPRALCAPVGASIPIIRFLLGSGQLLRSLPNICWWDYPRLSLSLGPPPLPLLFLSWKARQYFFLFIPSLQQLYTVYADAPQSYCGPGEGSLWCQRAKLPALAAPFRRERENIFPFFPLFCQLGAIG